MQHALAHIVVWAGGRYGRTREDGGVWRNAAGCAQRPSRDRTAVRAAMSGGSRACLLVAAILTLLYSGTPHTINKSLTNKLKRPQKNAVTFIIFHFVSSIS